MHDVPSEIATIETDEPTRSDELIELARHSRRGRFSLRRLLMGLVLVSVLFGLLRFVGVFDRWQHYYWLAIGGAFYFAPMLCLCLAAWFWPRPRGHNQLAVAGTLVLALVFVWSMLVAKVRPSQMMASVIIGLVLWGIQFLCLVSVQWSLFRDRLPRRRLPEELPKSDPNA